MLRAFPMIWRWLKYPVAFALAGIGLVLVLGGFGLLLMSGPTAAGLGIDIAATIILSIWSLGLAIALVRPPRTPTTKTPGTARRIFRLVAVVAGLASLCIVMPPVFTQGPFLVYLVSHENPGPFDRSKMEQIVADIRRFDFKEHQNFFIDPSGKVRLGQDPGLSLHDFIEADRDDDGSLTVVIVTRNLGHAGVYGFAYSDKVLKPYPDEASFSGLSLDVPSGVRETNQRGKIDDHWWKVANSQP